MKTGYLVHKRSLLYWGCVAIFLSIVTGCAQTTVKPQAFGKSKQYAIVTIFSNPEITSTNQSGASVTGLVKAISKDSGYKNDADKILKDSVPIVFDEFRKNTHFKLLSENSVIKTDAYAKAKGSQPRIFLNKLLTAEGYKYFDKPEQAKELASDLHVDGVITVSINYGYQFNGVNLMGLAAAGAHHATVNMTVVAYDQDGNIVWNDSAQNVSEESLSSIGESVDFVKLYPLLIASTQACVTGIMGNLDKKL